MNNTNQNVEAGKTNWDAIIEELIARSKKGNFKSPINTVAGVTIALLKEAAIKYKGTSSQVVTSADEKLSVYHFRCNHREKKFRIFLIGTLTGHCLYIIHTDDQNKFKCFCTDIFDLVTLISQHK